MMVHASTMRPSRASDDRASGIASPRRRRAGILLAVLVVVTMAALAGTSATYLAQAELQTASVSQRRVQARALAWSGVQAAMMELAQQRAGILLGEEPRLTEEWELYEDPSGRRAVVRLIASPSGEVVQSEQARLDINTATEEMLAGLELDEPLISALLRARERRAFGSPAELLQVEGFTPEILFGPRWGEQDRSWGGVGLNEGAGPESLIERLTVFSFDPNIQVGLGPGASTHRGRLRINLNTPWSDRLGNAIDDRFGRGTGDLARGFMATGVEINSLAVLIQGAAMNSADRRLWPILVDAFAVSDDPFIQGRIDLNRAPAEVLACVPGISLEAAEQIVHRRENLEATMLRSILWPLQEEILGVEEMAEAADHLTTRTMQWRVVVEGGFVGAGDRRSWRDLEEEALEERVVLEAVIDIASQRARIAYLRAITLLPVARALAAAMELEMDGDVDPAYHGRDEAEAMPPVELEEGESPSVRDMLQERRGESLPERSILELALQGPIEQDAREAGTSAGDQRIGRWTPGPAGKGNEP